MLHTIWMREPGTTQRYQNNLVCDAEDVSADHPMLRIWADCICERVLCECV